MKVGNQYKHKKSGATYEVYALTGLAKNIPTDGTVVYLKLVSKYYLPIVRADEFVTIPANSLESFFTESK